MQQKQLTNILQTKVKLSDGREIPQIGLGTWKVTSLEEVEQAIDYAVSAGYRHFDTAEAYENEEQVGKGLKKALLKYGLKREDIWLTTKIAVWQMSYEGAKESMNNSLEAFDLEYIDLVLIHWPTSIAGEAGETGRLETWKALEEFKTEGKVKSIGVSNFYLRHIESFYEKVKEKPVVNQIEIHPLYIEEETIKFCQEKGIKLIAYAPLATFDKKLMESEIVISLCKKHNKQPHQIVLRWAIDRGFIVIPKSK